MVFEFQLKQGAEDWELIGRTATPGEHLDIEEAAIALRDLRDGHLPTGLYRVRAGDGDAARWWPAEVDRNGVFRRLDV